jgi:DNA-binding MarR family transcriptional regulator
MENKPVSPTLANLDLAGTGYCASLNCRRAARAVTRVYDAALQDAGIRSTQFAILVAIAKIQPASITNLGEVLVIDRSTLTRSLRLLQKDRMITVSKRAAMRQRFLQLTPHGEKTLQRSLPLWRAAHERFVATVGPEYWLKLRNELEALTRTTLAMGLSPAAASLPDKYS